MYKGSERILDLTKVLLMNSNLFCFYIFFLRRNYFSNVRGIMDEKIRKLEERKSHLQ